VGLAPASVRAEIEATMQDALNDAVAQAFPDRSPAELEARLSCGHPAQALIDESKEADLLVVGISRHGAFTGMLVGSGQHPLRHQRLLHGDRGPRHRGRRRGEAMTTALLSG
jgi:hypothetical protein